MSETPSYLPPEASNFQSRPEENPPPNSPLTKEKTKGISGWRKALATGIAFTSSLINSETYAAPSKQEVVTHLHHPTTITEQISPTPQNPEFTTTPEPENSPATTITEKTQSPETKPPPATLEALNNQRENVISQSPELQNLKALTESKGEKLDAIFANMKARIETLRNEEGSKIQALDQEIKQICAENNTTCEDEYFSETGLLTTWGGDVFLDDKRNRLIGEDQEIQKLEEERQALEKEIDELELKIPEAIDHDPDVQRLTHELAHRLHFNQADQYKSTLLNLDIKAKQEGVESIPAEYQEFFQFLKENNVFLVAKPTISRNQNLEDNPENKPYVQSFNAALESMTQKENPQVIEKWLGDERFGFKKDFLDGNKNKVDALKILGLKNREGAADASLLHLEANRRAMLELETKSQGSVMFLFENCGIADFTRYDQDLLIRQYDFLNAIYTSEDETERERLRSQLSGYILYQLGSADHNGAFNINHERRALRTKINTLPPNSQHAAIFIEAQNHEDYNQKTNFILDTLGQKADVVILNGHGTPDSIQLGVDPKDALDTTSIMNTPGTFANSVKPGGAIILVSCSTGETSVDNNIAKTISQVAQDVYVYAPDVKSTQEDFELTVNNDGELTVSDVIMHGIEGYDSDKEERVTKYYQARMYRNGQRLIDGQELSPT